MSIWFPIRLDETPRGATARLSGNTGVGNTVTSFSEEEEEDETAVLTSIALDNCRATDLFKACLPINLECNTACFEFFIHENGTKNDNITRLLSCSYFYVWNPKNNAAYYYRIFIFRASLFNISTISNNHIGKYFLSCDFKGP